MSPVDRVATYRFGYGPAPRNAVPPLADQLAGLTRPDPAFTIAPPVYMADRLPATIAFRKARQAEGKGDIRAAAEVKALRQKFRTTIAQDFRDDLARAAFARHPFRERLVRFWADHFTAVGKNVATRYILASHADQAIRPHVAGRFEDLLIAAVTHPMMLNYLDQFRSFGPNSPIGRNRGKGLNENLAREILELHTLGVSAGYSQADVREFAELLTGLAFDRQGRFLFVPGMAEPGAEQVLGRAYGGGAPALEDIHAALRDIARRPDTGRHIATKLAVHFVADNPPRALVDAMSTAWADTGGALGPVYEVLTTHAAALDTEPAKVRRPLELMVGAIRALALTQGQVIGLPPQTLQQAVNAPMIAMGQPWRTPRGPDGWAEAAADWITPQGLAARIDWAMTAPRVLAEAPPDDPATFAVTVLGNGMGETTAWAVARAESRWEAVGLVFASPEFNRR